MAQRLHPAAVLYPGGKGLPTLAACEHYAGSEKLIRKALALQVQLAQDSRPIFDVTADCEDGAPTGAEREHAELVARLLLDRDNHYGRLGVRIHDIRHPHWRDDLAIILGQAAHRVPYIVLPKVDSLRDVQIQADEIAKLCSPMELPKPIPLHVLIETPSALHEAWQIASHPGVESIDFGLMDYVSAHHGAIPGTAMRSPGQFEHPLIVRAKCEISAAALGNGIIPAHNVTTELNDVEAVRRDALRARNEFGFLRMWSIHPNQILPIVEAMRPTHNEVELASEIICQAQDANWGPIRHGTTLHDRASYRYYWTVLSRANSTGSPISPEVRERFFALP